MAVTSNTMTGIDGSKVVFPFTFPYQNITDIKVELTRSPHADNLTGATTSTILNSTEFKLAPDAVNVTLSALDTVTDFQETSGAPKAETTGVNGFTVTGRVYRNTDSSQLTATFYPGSAIRSSDLNNNFTQNLYVTQESEIEVEDATKAVERLVGFTTDDGATWVTTGGGTNASTDPKGLRYGIITADAASDTATDAKDTYAIPAKQATDALVGSTSDGGTTWTLAGDGVSPNPKGVKYAVDQVEKYVADDNGLKGDGQGGNPQGVAYAVDQINTYVHDGTNPVGDGQGGNPQGLKYAIDTADDSKDNFAVPAKNATDALVGVYNNSTNAWETKGHAVSGDPESGVGKALDDADGAKNATDALVATNTGTTANPVWVLQGDGSNNTQNNKGVKYAVETAETARDTYAIPAKSATDTYVHDGTSLQGGGPADSQPKGVKYAIDQVEKYVHDGTALAGDGVSPNPKGVAYAVDLAESARDSVQASAIYKLTDDLSDLTTTWPINANNHEVFVQVNDTTGISRNNGTWSGDFNTPSGTTFPSTFSGNAQLTLKIRVNNTTGKYDVVEYYANDPEARYGEDRKLIVETRHTLDENIVIQGTMNAYSVGPAYAPVTISNNGTALTYNPENHAQPFVATNLATAGYTVTIPSTSTWFIN